MIFFKNNSPPIVNDLTKRKKIANRKTKSGSMFLIFRFDLFYLSFLSKKLDCSEPVVRIVLCFPMIADPLCHLICTVLPSSKPDHDNVQLQTCFNRCTISKHDLD